MITGIDGQGVTKLTCGIIVAGRRAKPGREGKVTFSICCPFQKACSLYQLPVYVHELFKNKKERWVE